MEAGLAHLARHTCKRNEFVLCYMRKFYPACWENFVVLTVVRNNCQSIFELSFQQTGQHTWEFLYGEIFIPVSETSALSSEILSRLSI